MKLSYNRYPFLRYADKRIIEKEGAILFDCFIIANPKTERERIANVVTKSLFIDGLLINKPIYYLAPSFSKQLLEFSEKNALGQKGDPFFIQSNLIYISEDVLNELEECIMITHSNIMIVHHIYKDSHYFIGFNISGKLLSYSILSEKGECIYSCEAEEGHAISTQVYMITFQVFKKYAEVELFFIPAGSKQKHLNVEKGKIINELGVDVVLLDSRWFREIVRTSGFKVRGHFRLQPYKDENGVWKRKLIYINEFEKHGYHRRALIEFYGEQKPKKT